MTDTQALVLNEAAYMKVPIIYTDPEISDVTIHQKTGILVEPDDNSIADALLELANNPKKREALGKAGHERARLFSIERQTDYLLAIYKKALKS